MKAEARSSYCTFTKNAIFKKSMTGAFRSMSWFHWISLSFLQLSHFGPYRLPFKPRQFSNALEQDQAFNLNKEGIKSFKFDSEISVICENTVL